MSNQLMLLNRGFGIQPGTKATWVVVTQTHAIIQFNVDVIVLARSRVIKQDSQIARHAQMHDQHTPLQLDQQILGTPVSCQNALILNLLWQLGRHWPAQAGIAHRNPADSAINNVWLYAASGSFDLG
jgi:hypothetical protein